MSSCDGSRRQFTPAVMAELEANTEARGSEED